VGKEISVGGVWDPRIAALVNEVDESGLLVEMLREGDILEVVTQDVRYTIRVLDAKARKVSIGSDGRWSKKEVKGRIVGTRLMEGRSSIKPGVIVIGFRLEVALEEWVRKEIEGSFYKRSDLGILTYFFCHLWPVFKCWRYGVPIKRLIALQFPEVAWRWFGTKELVTSPVLAVLINDSELMSSSPGSHAVH